jgi:CubicO group peptidase (beta-lactamase class C family)
MIASRRMGWYTVLVLVLVLHARRSAVGQASRAPLAGMDDYIERAMRAWGVAGVAVSVVKDDSVVYARGFGVREVGKPERVDRNTLFAIGSNTKLFTAVVAGMLVDEGRLRWDDPVIDHLPDFRLYDPWTTREVTIRDLLAHRTGLGEQRGNMIGYASGHDRLEVLRRMRFLTPASSFRSRFAYQNLGFVAAGEAAAAAAHQRWDELIRDRVFRPLGMASSNTSVRELTGRANVASPHAGEDGRLTPLPWRNIDNIGPAGSINSSASDMARWVKFLLAGGRWGTVQLLRSSTLREIEAPQTVIPCAPDSLRPSVHFCAYGLGVLMNDYLGVKVLSHSGGIDGMLSDVTMVPERGLGIVVLTNTDGHNALFAAIARRILDAYLGAPRRDWSAVLLESAARDEEALRALETRAEEKRAKHTRPSLGLSAYRGRYANELYGDLTIRLEEGRLVLRLGPTLAGTLDHWAFDTFKVNWSTAADRHALGPTFVSFELDPFGEVGSLRVRDDVTRLPGQGAWDDDVFTRLNDSTHVATNDRD